MVTLSGNEDISYGRGERSMITRPMICGLFLVLGLAGGAYAQTETGRISGSVVDQQGAAVPGVSITATSATGVARTTVSDPAGKYVLANLIPAAYDVNFQLQGFKTSTQRVQVRVGSDVTANAKLEVGGLTETVSVTAAAERI